MIEFVSELLLVSIVYKQKTHRKKDYDNSNSGDDCNSSYPDVCISPYPSDLNCDDISKEHF